MKRVLFIVLIAAYLFPLTTNALSDTLKKMYPYTVLTDDHGLLNSIDLDSKLDGIKHPSLFSHQSNSFIYWQCFPREFVTVSLEDLGFSPEDDEESDIKYNGENDARLIITARDKQENLHQYTMCSHFSIVLTKNHFDRYLQLMHGEQYVCLAGDYLRKETRKANGKKQQIYSWNFDKMKTAKGCEAYAQNGCHYGKKI